jgi:hypothetical protein
MRPDAKSIPQVLWIGERDARQKLDISILSVNLTDMNVEEKGMGRGVDAGQTGRDAGREFSGFSRGIGSMPTALNVGLWPHTNFMKVNLKRDRSDVLAAQISEGIMEKFEINASVRAPALDKLVVEVTFDTARDIAEWLAEDAYVLGLERKTMFAARNDASNRYTLISPTCIMNKGFLNI